MSDSEAGAAGGGEHRITPLELFFDLVMVFAFTQVTGLLATDPRGSVSFAGCSSWRHCGGRGTDTHG